MGSLTCTKCGEIKTGSYVEESWCSKCTAASRAARRKRKREEAGLPEWGSGRDPKCKICRKEKEESYKNGSWCRACKLEKAKLAYQKKARELGIEPRKKDKKTDCAKCGKEKERLDQAYCNGCKAEIKRARHAANKDNPDYIERLRKKANDLYNSSYEHRLKRKCREATHRRIASGKLLKQPCEVCGEVDVEAHHDDYTKPMDVRWLCKKHHAEHHANNKTKE